MAIIRKATLAFTLALFLLALPAVGAGASTGDSVVGAAAFDPPDSIFTSS